MEQTLWQTVKRLSNLAQGFSDTDLEKRWEWKGYDEGARFALFRVYEELRSLEARLEGQRQAAGLPVTIAQRSLAQHHAAFRDLQAVLLGVDDDLGAQPPAEGEWPLCTVATHILEAERAFFFVIEYTLRRARSKDKMEFAIPEDQFEAALQGDAFPELEKGKRLSALMEYYETFHSRVLDTFQDISNNELGEGSVFWEEEPFPIEFRLHRFDSHLRQHTIQAEKTLQTLGRPPSEAKRLLRRIYNAMAECEGTALGASELTHEAQTEVAQVIERYRMTLAGLQG